MKSEKFHLISVLANFFSFITGDFCLLLLEQVTYNSLAGFSPSTLSNSTSFLKQWTNTTYLSTAIFQHHVHIVLVLKETSELDHIGMMQATVQLNFTEYLKNN